MQLKEWMQTIEASDFGFHSGSKFFVSRRFRIPTPALVKNAFRHLGPVGRRQRRILKVRNQRNADL